MKKIGFSATTVQGGRSGVAHYTFALLEQLLARPEIDLTVFVLPEERRLFRFAEKGCRIIEVPTRASKPIANILWHQIELPHLARRLKLDAIHVPSYRRMIASAPCPLVATIHDLAPFRLKGKYDPFRMFYGKVVAKQLAKKQRGLISVSRNTADDIEHFFGIESESVNVIHNGIDHHRFHPRGTDESRESIARRFGIENPFFLYVSRLEHPGKNHIRLIQAFENFRKETGCQWDLVLAGGEWHGAGVIRSAASESAIASSIHFLGFVPDWELPTLYRAAETMVFPSLFEGFGLPPVEAMACGTPVISSTRGALREILGGAALTIDPESVEDISTALISAATNPELSTRFRNRGFENAQRFRWEINAQKTVQLYRRVMEESHVPFLSSPKDLRVE